MRTFAHTRVPRVSIGSWRRILESQLDFVELQAEDGPTIS
jgi:hypothetical protein